MGDWWRDRAEALAGYERSLMGLPLAERTHRITDGIDERVVAAR